MKYNMCISASKNILTAFQDKCTITFQVTIGDNRTEKISKPQYLGCTVSHVDNFDQIEKVKGKFRYINGTT